MMGISDKLRAVGKATEGLLSQFFDELDEREVLAAAAGYVENAGSPVSVLRPDFVGQRCFDTTNSLWYRAHGTTTTSWRLDAQGVLDSSGNITGLATGRSGDPFAIGHDVYVRNLKGLRRFAAAMARAWYSPAQINCFGDSVVLGTYSNDSTVPVDGVADLQSWPGVLRTMLATDYNLGVGITGGGFIAANDGRNTLSGVGSVTQTVGLPINTVRVDNTPVSGGALPITSGATISIPLPACTYVEIIYMDSNTASVQGGAGVNTGTFSYSIDGGATLATTSADNNTPINYKRISTGLTALSNTTHTLLITCVTLTCYIVGVLYRQATGIQVNRFGLGGATALDLTGEGYETHFGTGGPNRIRGFFSSPLTASTSGDTCSITSGSAVVTTASTANYKRGMPIGANAQIAASCYVASVDSATQFTMSTAATGTNAARPLWIGAGAGTLVGDLWIICVGHNDWQQQNNGTYNSSSSGMSTQLQTMINQIVDAGACVLLVGEPKSNTASPSPEADPIENYWAALTALATANDHVACMQINQQWGTFAQGVAMGFQNSNSGVHPLRLGCANFAGLIYKLLHYVSVPGTLV